MKPHLRVFSLTLTLVVGMFYSPLAPAHDDPPLAPTDPDYAQAQKAINAKDWDAAVKLLMQAVLRDDKNPDIYNSLGYAERNRGNMESAFSYYEKALILDPKHLGAREYMGEAYLLTGNLAKAEEQLAALDKLCFFSCLEYRELKEKITAYKQKQQATNNGKQG
jgi:tetratricopeptide (TPR) repeat protein